MSEHNNLDRLQSNSPSSPSLRTHSARVVWQRRSAGCAWRGGAHGTPLRCRPAQRTRPAAQKRGRRYQRTSGRGRGSEGLGVIPEDATSCAEAQEARNVPAGRLVERGARRSRVYLRVCVVWRENLEKIWDIKYGMNILHTNVFNPI